MSKTPDFDNAIGDSVNNLGPHTKRCANFPFEYSWCETEFKIEEEDIKMYRMLKVPPPTLCWRCRLQRRLGWRISDLPIFHKKTCSAPGHDEKIISFHSQDNPVKVYDDDYYVSDQWDAIDYGRDYDPHRSFFEQWYELKKEVPHQALQRELVGSVNCEYTISGLSSKNAYYVAVPYYTEDVQYGWLPVRTKNSLVVSRTEESEKLYNCMMADRCFNCQYCVDCSDCLDSYYLFDCRNSSNCFMSANLRNKQYIFRGQQLTKKEYQKRMDELDLGKRSVREELEKEFKELYKNAVHRDVFIQKSENSIGDEMQHCKNCYMVFETYQGPNENNRYSVSLERVTDSMDIYGAAPLERGYESTAVPHGADVKFSLMARTCNNVEYSMECSNCDYIFGCIGLRGKKYCILNKQYTEEEYWKKIDEIKTKMLDDKEYGEFPPVKMSPHPYNNSNAQNYYPLSKNQVIARDWFWEDEKESHADLSNMKVLRISETPDDIAIVNDDILDVVLLCQRTEKPFRITKFELQFYRNHNIPLPSLHPLERLKENLQYHHPYNLWNSKCTKCDKDIKTVHNPSKNFNVYCEMCYLQNIG